MEVRLSRRHKVSSHGTKLFREEIVFGELRVLSLHPCQPRSPFVSLPKKSIGKPAAP